MNATKTFAKVAGVKVTATGRTGVVIYVGSGEFSGRCTLRYADGEGNVDLTFADIEAAPGVELLTFAKDDTVRIKETGEIGTIAHVGKGEFSGHYTVRVGTERHVAKTFGLEPVA